MTTHDPSLAAAARQAQPARPLILLEFNELCPHLLARWMADGSLPHFKALHDRSAVFTTTADVDDSACLEPWIQWYSVHTGLAYDQHKVFHLTEGKLGGHDDIYALARRSGLAVSSFASMNVAPFAQDGSVFVGDPWSENGDAFPPELNLYNRFVSQNVREYSNASARMSLSDYARFAGFMASHGLRPATVIKVIDQLARERFADKLLSWQRVAILDAIQFDVFRHYWRKQTPDFATFFLNSTAHLQHSYWRHHEPAAFTVKPDAAEMAIYGDAVQFGYQQMDGLIGDFTALARKNDARLILAGALSQQPFLRHEESGGQHFYRLTKVEAFLANLGLKPVAVDPTMTHQYLAKFENAAAAKAARKRLAQLALDDGRDLIGFPTKDAAADSLYFGCQISTTLPAGQMICDAATNQAIGFFDHFYKIDAIKSGRHHPDGVLWIESGAPGVHTEKRAILDIYPTLADLLGIIPAEQGRRGVSLMPLIG